MYLTYFDINTLAETPFNFLDYDVEHINTCTETPFNFLEHYVEYYAAAYYSMNSCIIISISYINKL